VIVAPYVKASSAEFARLLMSEFLLKFGICAKVVIDDDSQFKGVFLGACKALGISYHLLSKRNHQAMRCERYFRYQNKVMKIECTRRNSNRIFVEVAQVCAYAWNSMPIDGTNIVRSFAVCGRVYRLPLEIAMDEMPELSDDVALSVQRYLTSLGDEHGLAKEMLRLLSEERREAHRERINAQRKQVIYKLGDLVTAKVQRQSNESLGRVGKLTYDHVGPYIIVEVCGNDSYLVQKQGVADGATRKYKASDLQTLSPVLHPCFPLDSIDYKFLNQHRAPVLHALKDYLGIDSYNQVWLGDGNSHSPADSEHRSPLDIDATNPQLISVEDLEQSILAEPGPDQLLLDTCDDVLVTPRSRKSGIRHSDPSVSWPDSESLFSAIQQSKDKMFFINYTSDESFVPQLQLVQVELDASARSEPTMAYRQEGLYYCEFFARIDADERTPWNNC